MDHYQLSDQEIIRDWTLTTTDKALVEQLNKASRIWMGVQLCAVRLYGRLLENPHELSSQVISYICRQLNLDPTIHIGKPTRKATYIEHRRLIFKHLQFSNFDSSARKMLEAWIIRKIQEGQILTEQLYDQAAQFLVISKIALPSSKELKRLISSLCNKYQQELFKKLYQSSGEKLKSSIDQILTLTLGNSSTFFQKLKEYPPSATITLLESYLEKYHLISQLDLAEVDLEILNQSLIKHLYKIGKYYSADAVKNFKPEKKYAVMVAFLAESKKILLDYIIQIHDQYISDICRQCKNIHEDRLIQYRNNYDKGVDKIGFFIDQLIVHDESQDTPIYYLRSSSFSQGELAEMVKSRVDMATYLSYSKFGYALLLQNRYSSMRRYFVDFIQLPFEAEQGSSPLMRAIHIIGSLDSTGEHKLPADTPYHFIDYKISKAIFNPDRSIKRSIWEVGVAIAIRDALRAGDLYLPTSKRYVSFWKLIYNDGQWEKEKDTAYKELAIEPDVNDAIQNIISTFHATANQASKAFGVDGFAQIKNDRLKLFKKDKLEDLEEGKKLQKIVNSYLPKIKIERLLIAVDHLTGFTKHFTPMHGQKSKPANFYKALMASILSQATNIGIATMEDCTTGISSEVMSYIIDTYIREDTIKEANAEIVNKIGRAHV